LRSKLLANINEEESIQACIAILEKFFPLEYGTLFMGYKHAPSEINRMGGFGVCTNATRRHSAFATGFYVAVFNVVPPKVRFLFPHNHLRNGTFDSV